MQAAGLPSISAFNSVYCEVVKFLCMIQLLFSHASPCN